MPGGFPHRSIGLAAFAVVVLAAVLTAALLRGSIPIVIAIAVGVPIVIVLLVRNAARHRNRLHPSR